MPRGRATLASASGALLLLLLHTCTPPTTAAAAASASGCTATATYPDGREVERECIVEGEKGSGKDRAAPKKGISDEMKWLKDTRWLWNEWREVIFKADGSFLAPAENCERPGNPKCKWTADDDRVYVTCAPRHAITPSGRARAQHP